MVQRLMPATTLTPTAEIADRDSGLGINGKTDGSGISIRLGVDPMDSFKNGVGLRHFAQRLTLDHAAWLEAELAKHPAKAAFGGNILLAVVPFKELALGFGGSQAAINLGGAEGRNGLAGCLADGPQIVLKLW